MVVTASVFLVPPRGGNAGGIRLSLLRLFLKRIGVHVEEFPHKLVLLCEARGICVGGDVDEAVLRNAFLGKQSPLLKGDCLQSSFLGIDGVKLSCLVSL